MSLLLKQHFIRAIAVFFSYVLGNMTIRAIAWSTPHYLETERGIVVCCISVFKNIVGLTIPLCTAKALNKVAKS